MWESGEVEADWREAYPLSFSPCSEVNVMNKKIKHLRDEIDTLTTYV